MPKGYRPLTSLDPVPAVRKATLADIDLLSEAITRAFDDDPIWQHVFPERHRHERARVFTAYELRHHYLGEDETWTTAEGVKGAAVWMPPKKWKQSRREALRAVPTLLRVMGAKSVAAYRVQSAIEAAHPPGEHYYLSILGTDPTYQGQGVASACLEPVLTRCDEQGIGAYLESSKEQNIPFYNRHGFEVTRELKLPGGCPSLWLMWRDPR